MALAHGVVTAELERPLLANDRQASNPREGLTSAQAAALLQEFGRNEIVEEKVADDHPLRELRFA